MARLSIDRVENTLDIVFSVDDVSKIASSLQTGGAAGEAFKTLRLSKELLTTGGQVEHLVYSDFVHLCKVLQSGEIVETEKSVEELPAEAGS